ncbi:hypothetical protein K461DRAFT_99658 [Myriangium duriaei CBS 260.36]|uniref:Uncharacterized protein n=1 Tax=Myriangium duriaei CBS 260.36 TaxID=1168546 RepID=A0A9P4J3X1_9PEZI|nr:hypothetical protein K461DRAFT_99658 [Myriangium duriaei CBS 260.36]
MSSYPGASYLSGPLPGPPPGPPPVGSRSSSHHSQRSQHSAHSYGHPSPYEQPVQPPYPTSSQPPNSQPPTSHPQQMPTIPQQRPISQAQLRSQSYSQPQYLSGSYPPPGYFNQMQGSPMQGGHSAPMTPGGGYGYPLGEPAYSLRPDMDPRRASQSSHRSARSTASYNSRRSGYSRHSGMDNDEWYDSGLDSEEEDRRRRKQERHRRRKEKESSSKDKRPTMADSVFALFGELKSDYLDDGLRHTTFLPFQHTGFLATVFLHEHGYFRRMVGGRS